jgi:hypothetical protein
LHDHPVASPLLQNAVRPAHRKMSIPTTPVIELFLLLEQPRQRQSHWAAALAPLDSQAAPPVAGIDAYYDEAADQAVIAVRYDRLALGEGAWSFVDDVVRLAEIPMVQPSAMSDGDRRRFIIDRIGRCDHHVYDQRTIAGALGELVRKIRAARSQDAAPTATPGVSVSRTVTPARGSGMPPRVPAQGTMPVPRTTTARTTTATAVPRTISESTPFGTPLVADGTPAPPQAIQARYLRSGRWVAVRVAALSLKGVTLVTGALARQGETAHVALGFATHRALARGTVARVSTVTEEESTGAASFEVRFELDEPSRRQLVALLSAARAANITLKPPPPRAARRFPVAWPVSLATPRGAVSGDALDISQHGMFIHPTTALPFDTNLNFSAVLDDGNRPVAGRARVVRQISETDAERRGLAPGYGVQIVDMGDTDHTRWLGFLARVQLRTEKRVLIGAGPTRLIELQTGLAAAGYAVTGGTDAGTVVQLADADGRLVDAAVIDGTWVGEGASWLESLFTSRNVPCVTMHGDARRARSVVDRMLEVA